MAVTYSALVPDISNLHSNFSQLNAVSSSILERNRIEGSAKILEVLSDLLESPENLIGSPSWVLKLCSAIHNIDLFLVFVNNAAVAKSGDASHIQHVRHYQKALTQCITSLRDNLRQLGAPLNGEFPMWVGIGPAPELVKTQQQYHDQLALIGEQLDQYQLRILEFPEKINLQLQSACKTIEKPLEDYKERLQELAVQFEKKKTDAEAEVIRIQQGINLLFSKLAGNAMAGNYGENALDEKAQADSFRIYATAFMAVTVLLGGWMYYETFGADYNWQSSLSRLVIILLLSVPSAYFAKESIRHRQQYHQQLRMSLDLHAINPFLASLPIDEQNKLRGEIALRLFGSRDSSGKLNEGDSSTANDSLAAFVKKMIDSK